MPGERPAVVFLPGQAAALAQHVRVARAMAAAGELQPVVVVPKPFPNEPDDGVDGVRVVRLHGGGTVRRSDREQSAAGADATTRRAGSWLGRLRHESLPAVHLRARRRATRLRAEAARMATLLRGLHARAVVVSGDRTPGPELSILRAARDLGLGSVLVPFAHSDPAGSAVIRADRPVHDVDAPPMESAKRHVASRFPGQVFTYEGRRLLFYGPVGTLALHASGQLPERPWWAGGGPTDRVCVLSESEREQRIGVGIAAERIVVTGDVALDDLHAARAQRDALRVQLVARHGLSGDPTLVLLAPPQLAEQGVLPWPQHREQIHDLVARTATAGAGVLVSLHPKARREDYAFLDQVEGADVLDEPLAHVLPAADVFVASRSSTVAWAVALGIPTVVADFGWLGHTVWDDTDGVAVATDRTTFDHALRSLVSDGSARSRARDGLARSAARLSRFDGRATERTLDVIARAAAAGSGAGAR